MKWTSEPRTTETDHTFAACQTDPTKDLREFIGRPPFCDYIAENPVCADLSARWEDYPFTGCLITGYPEVDRADEMFWDRFWKIFRVLQEGTG